ACFRLNVKALPATAPRVAKDGALVPSLSAAPAGADANRAISAAKRDAFRFMQRIVDALLHTVQRKQPNLASIETALLLNEVRRLIAAPAQRRSAGRLLPPPQKIQNLLTGSGQFILSRAALGLGIRLEGFPDHGR